MTEQPITITRVPSDPPHFRAVYVTGFEAWSMDGMEWVSLKSGGEMTDETLRAAFHAQILAPTTPEQPERAKVGDRVSIFNNKPFTEGVVESIHKDCLMVKVSKHLSIGINHKDYTIVPPPTATGDKITEQDGVWEENSTGYIQALVIGGSVVSVVGKDGRWHDPRDISPSANFTLISTDPADLTKGWKGEAT